jgi:hypothetical protein
MLEQSGLDTKKMRANVASEAGKVKRKPGSLMREHQYLKPQISEKKAKMFGTQKRKHTK